MIRPAYVGIAALLIWLPHAFWHVSHHSPWDLLWMCNVSPLLIAAGCFAKAPRLSASGLCFLSCGTPLWLIEVAGGSLVPTSPLVHFGGLAVALVAARSIGFLRGTWWFAALLSVAILGSARVLTPPHANVNLVFFVYRGWEKTFPNHPLYLFLIWLGSAAAFAFIEYAAVRRFKAARGA